MNITLNVLTQENTILNFPMYGSSDIEEDYEFVNFRSNLALDGVVEKITVIDGKERVPNIGWHTINNNSLSQIPHKFFDGQNVGKQYYFIHSYHAIPRHNVDVSASIDYGGNKLAAVIGNESVIGVQFHPEKSGKDGLELLGKLKAEYWN